MPYTLEKDQFGLMTRESFISRVEKKLQKENKQKFCMVSVDIEHLKLLNNWFGQQMGDRVLEHIAGILLKLEKEKGYLAGRFGSDDFFLLMPDDEKQVEEVYDEVCKEIEKECPTANFRPVVGVCEIEPNEKDVAMLCNNAQIAAGAARGKEENRIRRFDRTMMHDIQRKQRLIADMKKALQERGFTFFLQPKCNSVTGAIVSMEALARWEHPEIGSISPAEFVPLMEQSGMVTWLDRFVWEGVCRLLRDWQAEGHRVVPISVNVSRQDFEAIDVPECFHKLVQRYHIKPALLRVEITETMFAENMEEIHRAVEQLHRYGFTVLMDDFGSGYSSLNMLKDTNVDVLKMDMKFFEMNQENREKGIQIIESVVDMAHKLHMLVIAEGVESAEQVEMLRSMNCIYVQGYYFYKPLPVEEVLKLVDRMDCDDYVCTDLRRKNLSGNGVRCDIRTKRDALDILAENALVLASLNLDSGELQIAKSEIPLLKGIDEAEETHFALFNNLIVAKKLIHPDDQEKYLRMTALSYLRDEFFKGKNQMYLTFRQKMNDGKYHQVALAAIAGKICKPGHSRVALVLRNIDHEAVEERRATNYDSDALTGLFNRARFERDLEKYAECMPQKLTCVYMDVVGLHEINNHLGHKAGDGMLCAVAGATRSVFQDSGLYRIGGDEFVALCENYTQEKARKSAEKLRLILKESDYEISIGIHEFETGEELIDGVDKAENAMRKDKLNYYERTGNIEQMRVLNEKLEKILVEKQDTDQFLRVIAPHYMGVYVVNTQTGKMRSIFIPERFKRMVKENNNMFFPALKTYENSVVKERYMEEFDRLFDSKAVEQYINANGMIYMTYQRKDGVWIRLQVMRYMESESGEGCGELLWIFSNASQKEWRV